MSAGGDALRKAAEVWQQGAWADAPRHADRVRERIATGQWVGEWLRTRAWSQDRLEGQDPPYLPSIGQTWVWEPLKPMARETVVVTEVRWNGEEYWIESESTDGQRHWNDLSRWVQATVLVTDE